ncbi:hypothetical protein GS636_21465 [Ruegeria sp. HKCCD4884]|uniref:hypothetical protein n=1 Tax=Ruegeria sp. HKCCD4884 TaxID=2683022 RepID=UPI0014917D22|nr:hypothetical protein [Ruegeria sp. HKCCD4884]NOD95375.1 hypothetical protein [Ruegeria sp. HKCCD4884]
MNKPIDRFRRHSVVGPGKECKICRWHPEDRKRLVMRRVAGASFRELASEFPANKDALRTHLVNCEAANIAAQEEQRHRAIDWLPILDTLADAGDAAGRAIQSGFERGDVASALGAVDKLSENVNTRLEIATNIRAHEHRQIAEALREISAHFVHADPINAPAIIDQVLRDRVHAQNALGDVLKSSKGADTDDG